MTRSDFRIAAILAATVLGTAAQAASFVALSDDQTLQLFDSKDRKVTATMIVKGLSAPLAGIDIRPADGQLYGLQRDGQIVTIDLRSGQASPKAKLDQAMPTSSAITVDFNPVADRLRVVGGDGTNLRINVDDGKTIVDGKLNFAASDSNTGKMPMVAAGAYTNKFKGAKETALYNIDAAGLFLKQAPPNDGVLSTLGTMAARPRSIAFNIESDGKGSNTGWLLADGSLSILDVSNGQTKPAGAVSGLSGTVRDIAVLPSM